METVISGDARLCAMSLGSGKPLVMLHGLGAGSMATWYSMYASPLSAQRQVVLYDQRGHGSSSLPASGYDLDAHTGDLEAVLAHFGFADRPVDLVGHSMGALIALHFALRRPQSVRRLVLVDAPMPASRYVAPSLQGVESHEALARWIDLDLTAKGAPGGRGRARLVQRLTALLVDTSVVEDVAAMDGEDPAALAKLDRPVLLVAGRTSPCRRASEMLAEWLPQARLEWADCAHDVPGDAAAALGAWLDEFLIPDAPRRDDTAPAGLPGVMPGMWSGVAPA